MIAQSETRSGAERAELVAEVVAAEVVLEIGRIVVVVEKAVPAEAADTGTAGPDSEEHILSSVVIETVLGNSAAVHNQETPSAEAAFAPGIR
jgi:hypothetical protein